jgi:hypothetical protein
MPPGCGSGPGAERRAGGSGTTAMETARGIVCPHSLRVTVCTRLWAVEAIATLRFGLLAPIAHPPRNGPLLL